MRRLDPVLWRRLQAAAREEVDALLRSLPPALRRQADAIPVVFEPWPSKEIVQEGYDPDLLGLFVGHEHADDGADPLPPEILLFLWNIWDYAGRSAPDYREEVRRTLLHELGHYLGLNEDGLADRDLD